MRSNIMQRCKVYIDKKQKKRRLPKKAVFFLTSISVVLLVLITGLVMLLTKGREIKDALEKLPVSNVSAYLCVGNKIVYTDGKYLTCVNDSLQAEWTREMPAADLNYTASDTIVLATSDTMYWALDQNGVLLFYNTVEQGVVIESARAGLDMIAILVSQPQNDITATYIEVFNSKGERMFDDPLSVTGRNILDYGFDAQSDLLYLLELDVSGVAPVSRICTYRPGAEMLSMTGIKDLKDQLVSRVYLTGELIYAMGTNYLTTFKALKQNQNRLIYGWSVEDICTEGESPVFVYVQSDEMDTALSVARIIRSSGDEIKINLPPGVFSVLYTKEKIYCFASDRIFVYTVEGKYQRTHSLPFAATGVQKAMDGYAFISEGETVYLLPLP